MVLVIAQLNKKLHAWVVSVLGYRLVSIVKAQGVHILKILEAFRRRHIIIIGKKRIHRAGTNRR